MLNELSLYVLVVHSAHQKSSVNSDIQGRVDRARQCWWDKPVRKLEDGLIINHLYTTVQHSDAFQHLSFLGKVDFFPTSLSQPAACMLFQGEGDCQVSLRTPNICVVNWTVLLRLDPISDAQTLLNLLHVLHCAVQVLCIYFVIQWIKCGSYSREEMLISAALYWLCWTSIWFTL